MSGSLYRLIVAIVTALVAYANTTYSTHLVPGDVVAAIVACIGLGVIVADAIEAHGKHQAKAGEAFLPSLMAAADKLIGVIQEARKAPVPTDSSTPAPKAATPGA